ncbi:hypothetical protein NFJ02_23g53090 [Pycnococcus provasolii]
MASSQGFASCLPSLVAATSVMMMMMTVTSVHDAQAQYAGGSSSGGAEARGVVFQPGGGNRPAAGGAGSLYSSSYYYGDDDQSNNNNPAADNQRRRRRRQNGNNNNNIGNFNFQQQNNKQQITNTARSQYTDPRVRPNPAAVITPRPNEPMTAPLVQSSPPAVASGSVVVSAAATTTSSAQDTAALIERIRVWRKLYDEKLRREQLGGGRWKPHSFKNLPARPRRWCSAFAMCSLACGKFSLVVNNNCPSRIRQEDDNNKKNYQLARV